MIDTPHIGETGFQPTAFIHFTVKREEIEKVMCPGVEELTETLRQQAISITGPLFTYHRKRPTDTFDFKLSFPVDKPVVLTGRVQPGELPATSVARTVYHGNYEGLAAAWANFHTWISAQGHIPCNHLWESYFVGPEASPDSATWQTELTQPLVFSL